MAVKIRKWEMADAKDLAAALSNKAILNNLRDGLPYPYTERDAEEYISAMLAADPDNTFAYAVTVDDRVVGSIGAFRQENIHSQTAELGYYIAEKYWGKGIMTQAVRQLCDAVFAETDILRIYAEPFSYNVGSRRVLEKAGFQFEGILRCNAVKNGRTEDMALYALTRSMAQCTVKQLAPAELSEALSLIWEVFCQFEAPEYSEQGVQEFRSSLDDDTRNRAMNFYGAYVENELVGVLAMRKPQHIGYFFVKAAYHRRGIGKKLFEVMRQDYANQMFTVNSSPYAVKFYQHLGFRETDAEQTVKGLRFIPMKLEERTWKNK